MAARKPKLKPGDKLDAAPVRSRGYYTTPYGRFMSVTTLLDNGVAKPGLPYWYASEVAQRAIDAIPKLTRLRGQLARDEALKWLKGAANEKRDAAAELGTTIHNAIEARILGAPAPEPTEDQQPFLDAFARFWDDHQPIVEATEMTLANPDDGWAGTGDVWMTLPNSSYGRAVLLGDWKSGKKPHAETAMQCAAYRRAKVGWLKDGTEVVPPSTDGAVLIHIRPSAYPDTGYRIYPLDTSDEVYAAFLSVRDVALGWTKGLAKTALGDPLDIPTLDTAEVA